MFGDGHMGLESEICVALVFPEGCISGWVIELI